MELLKIKGPFYTLNNRHIIKNLTLSIYPQEVHAFLGANGSGKTTLAYLIMGCEGYRPTSGEIIFDGKIINDLPLHERARLGITMAWQEPVRFEGICVADYLSIKTRLTPSESLKP